MVKKNSRYNMRELLVLAIIILLICTDFGTEHFGEEDRKKEREDKKDDKNDKTFRIVLGIFVGIVISAFFLVYYNYRQENLRSLPQRDVIVPLEVELPPRRVHMKSAAK